MRKRMTQMGELCSPELSTMKVGVKGDRIFRSNQHRTNITSAKSKTSRFDHNFLCPVQIAKCQN